MEKVLVFLGTGGTIAGKASTNLDNVGYTAAQVGVQELLQSVAGLHERLKGCAVELEQVAQVDSKDITHAVWQALTERIVQHLARESVQAVVVTHGTDTLEETAYFLSRVLPSNWLAEKAVVLTCAMRPATALSPDGPQNLLDSVCVALDGRARGVLAVCAGAVHAAGQVQKTHPYRLDAFDSGESGPLAWVEEGRVRWGPAGCPVVSGLPRATTSDPASWPRVEVVLSHAGANGAVVRALCARASIDSPPLRGIVVAGSGNGTVHQDLERALVDAMAQGIRVVRSTRCAYGAVVPGGAAAIGEVSPQSPCKARIDLLLDLMQP